MNTFEYRNLKKKNYFEGWYQRLVDEDKNINYAFIFAITKNETDPHAFIQIFDGTKNISKYYRFDITDFYYSKDTVFIKDNYLSLNSLYLKTKDFEISVLFTELKQLKKRFWNNSAMSYLSSFPLECYQEVVVIDCSFEGEIVVDDLPVHITGKSYLEKTYGTKFPKKRIWIQGNHFNKDVSLSFSYGIVPFLKRKIKRFITIINYNDKEYRFASYNLSRVKIINQTKSQVEILIKKRRYRLIINVMLIEPIKLIGPGDEGYMNLEVFESVNSLATLTFYKGRKIIFDTMGRSVGFENMYV